MCARSHPWVIDRKMEAGKEARVTLFQEHECGECSPVDASSPVRSSKQFSGRITGIHVSLCQRKSTSHIYIRLPLMVGADFYRIAKNCRTSVEMIEKFYASHIRTLLDAAAINIARRKTAVSEGAKEPRNAA